MTSTAVFSAGHRVALGPHSILNASLPITLEDQVGSGAYLSIWTHGFHFGHRLLDGYDATFSPVHVEGNVWLGYHVTLLPGVSIGAKTIVAAGGVVTRDLPANMLAGGVPAVAKRALGATPLAGAEAEGRVRELLKQWAAELEWKGVMSDWLDNRTLQIADVRVLLLPSTEPLPDHLEGMRQYVLSVDDRPEGPGNGDQITMFELRSGRLRGALDDLGHDLRDHLRRNALPRGDSEPFRSLPVAVFDRLINPGRIMPRSL